METLKGFSPSGTSALHLPPSSRVLRTRPCQTLRPSTHLTCPARFARPRATGAREARMGQVKGVLALAPEGGALA
jgi:hypothetical protein